MINEEVMVPFTPQLIKCVLPNLAHHVAAIQSAARSTNHQLISVVRALPPPTEPSSRQNTDRASVSGPSPLAPASPVPTTSALTSSRPSTANREATLPSKDSDTPPNNTTPTAATPVPQGHRSRHSISQIEPKGLSSAIQAQVEASAAQTSRPESPISVISVPQVQQSPEASLLQEKEKDLIDYQATVNALTLQFMSEHEETRVAALKWLIMLHQKAPKKVRSEDCCGSEQR